MVTALLLLAVAPALAIKTNKHNILFILADDLGWNDVSWNNPDMPTPVLEQLAREGVRLDRAYSQQVDTLPSSSFTISLV